MSSQLQSPASLSTEHDGDHAVDHGLTTPEPNTVQSSGTKRKRTTPPTKPQKDERKKVSRACDICKTKKLRCSGTLPCSRCISQSLVCEYNFEHRRGNPASPEPGLPINNPNQNAPGYPSTPTSQHLEHCQPSEQPVPDRAFELNGAQGPKKSSRSSQEADETRFEGDYIGPTSGIAFLHRAQRRFQQDFVRSAPNSFDGQGPRNASVFSFGDGWFPDYTASEFLFPNRYEAKHLLDRYFDFAMPTYRFLHRSTVNAWLEAMCNEHEDRNSQRSTLSSPKIAIVLLTLATAKLYGEDEDGLLRDGEAKDSAESGSFFAEAERRLSNETGPVRLESVQARLAQCIYLLASSRINEAWYIFGTTTQMILALGLHRKRFSQTSGAALGLIEVECRKRVFWSSYTLDRYLSVILGRPRIFRDEDIDQDLPSRVNDADLVSSKAKTKSTHNQCVSDGLVFHAKLAKIIGDISSDLYPTNRLIGTKWLKSAERWTSELKAWKESLPAFLEPSKVDPAILIPIFQRQSTVLRLAYAHALILANRPSLLNNFGDLSRRKELPKTEPEGSLKECIDAAILVVETVNGFIEDKRMCKAFWFTHYISFCAIATLYVYTIQQSIPFSDEVDKMNDGSNISTQQSTYPRKSVLNIQHFEAAEKCQRSIAETMVKASPFRRYNIILDELKSEVLQRLGRVSVNDSTIGYPMAGQRTQEADLNTRDLVDSSGRNTYSTPNPSGAYRLVPQDISFELQPNAYGPTVPAIDFRSSHIPSASGQYHGNSAMDLDLFGSQGELMGWSEFDSCAITWPDGLGMYEPGLSL